MEFLNNFFTYINNNLIFLTWRDAIEIIFFSSLFYSVSCWLKKDKQKNLVGIFYLYVATFFTAYALDLYTVTIFLFIFTPSIIMIFTLFHQRTLQKNLIGLVSKTSAFQINASWTEELIKALLKAINNSKEIIFIIEKSDSLTEFLNCNLILNMPFSMEGFAQLLESNLLIPQRFLYVDRSGTLRGVNASINSTVLKEWSLISTETPASETWKYNAQLITHKMDSIVISANPINRKFSIVISGKILSHLNADTVHSLLRRYLTENKDSYASEGDSLNGIDIHNQKPVCRQYRA